MILNGHILDRIKDVPDNSIHCIVTSPPYWGLRAYGTEPQIWKNTMPLCEEHEWGDAPPRRNRKATDVVNMQSKQATSVGTQHDLPHTNFCLHCHAWRGEYGLEPTIDLYIRHTVEIFRELHRVLRPDGTCWLNLGDSYAGSWGATSHDIDGKAKRTGTNDRPPQSFVKSKRIDRGSGRWGGGNVSDPSLKPKDLCGIPWRVALALQADGWWLRSDIIWDKPNPMPESVTDRPTKSHEYIFLLTKSARYFYDAEAVREPYNDASLDRYRTPMMGTAPGARKPGGDVSRREREKAVRDPNPSGRNLRTVWKIATQPYAGAHFATFPEDIPARCIKAGTSAKGCCPTCGTPWERVVEKPKLDRHKTEARDEALFGKGAHRSKHAIKYDKKKENAGRLALLRNAAREEGGEYQNTVRTIGWQPTCTCGHENVIPCTVLDPFAGSGTTIVVAERMGRSAIGIELKQDYIEQHIVPRREQVNPLFRPTDPKGTHA